MNFENKRQFHFPVEICFLILLILLLLFTNKNSFAAETLTKAQQDALLKQISAPLPKVSTILVYNSEFAQRLGLDPKKAIQLDPGLYAVAFIVNRWTNIGNYEAIGHIPYFWWNHLSLNHDESQTLLNRARDDQSPLSVLLQQLFPNDPRTDSYECLLSLYLNESDPRVQRVPWPRPDLRWEWDENPFEGYHPVMSGFIVHVDDNKKRLDPVLNKTFGKDTDHSLLDIMFFELNGFGHYPGYTLEQSVDTPDDDDSPFSVQVKGIYKDFLPNMTFAQFSVDCDLISKLADKQGTYVWYEQKGLKMRKKNDSLNEKHLARFRIPPEISSSFKKTYTGNTFGSFISGGGKS